MILSEIKHLIRKTIHNKTFSIINIIGLTIGLIFSVIAFLYIQDELKYDKHFTNTKDVYRLTINNNRARTFHVGQPAIFFDEILKNIPEIKSGVRHWNDGVIMKIGDNTFTENNFLHVDSSFFHFYGWTLIYGNPDKVLVEPESIVISENKAKELFNENNPIGKTIRINNENDYTITGVFKDLPEQSHINTDFLVSLTTLKKNNPGAYNSWGWHSMAIYLKVNSKANIDLVNKKIADVWNNNSQDDGCVDDYVKARLQPFSDIYLKSGHLYGGIGNLHYVIGFAIIAGLILIISCFNFVNLFIAVHSKNTAETGIKKVLGAGRKIFIRQVMFEILLYLLVAIIICSLITRLILPSINNVVGKNLVFSILNNLPLLFFLILISIGILLISSIFPVVQMIYINTAVVLKGVTIFSLRSKTRTVVKGNIRNVLVITQFTIGIMLILSAIIINKQLKLIRQHDAGFDKEQVLVINNEIGNDINRFNYLKDVLPNHNEIQTITSGRDVPSRGINNWGATAVAGSEHNFAQFCGFVSVNEQYFNVIGADILKGRDFNEAIESDKDKIIINEALMKVLNLQNPVGTVLNKLWDNRSGEIIGVVKDIEFHSIRIEDIPTIFFFKNYRFGNYYKYIIIKLKSIDLSKTVALINDEWNKVSPDFPMDYFFLDEQFDALYNRETQLATLINIMTVVAIFLCCLGLFGLALFNINGRIKEIGVRKVNGAKTVEIMSLVNIEFFLLIITAYIIAIPISAYFLMKWLENFALKTAFPWWAVLLTGITALGIATLTVSWQSWKAARRNPVEALRYE